MRKGWSMAARISLSIMTRLSCPFCWIYFFFIDLRAKSCPVAFFLTSTTLAYEPLPMTERRA